MLEFPSTHDIIDGLSISICLHETQLHWFQRKCISAFNIIPCLHVLETQLNHVLDLSASLQSLSTHDGFSNSKNLNNTFLFPDPT